MFFSFLYIHLLCITVGIGSKYPVMKFCSECICPNCNMYLSQIAKCICFKLLLERTGLMSICKMARDVYRSTVVLDQIHSCLIGAEGEWDREWTFSTPSFLFYPFFFESDPAFFFASKEWEWDFSGWLRVHLMNPSLISSAIGASDIQHMYTEFFNWANRYPADI